MNQPHRTLEAMLDDDSPYARYDPAKNSLVKISSKSFLLGVVFTGALIGELTHPSQTDDDSFILEDREFHLITVISIVEYLVSPFHLHVVPIGLLLALSGQLVRTLSMGTAQESFNHYIQKSGKETHTLVTQGVYKYIRHPSYFGFFIWFVGLELLLGNILILVVGGIILWRFFRDRIRYEEEYLIKMFGADYQSYRANTKTWLYI
ncbi:Protein-S-isoprenylcysteine O-methyltransferase [Candida parapsilosis]|nr:Protein-S-isoprenylcysteine O-methyltransferase [Candida parapsilosis]KAI5909989.1 Protein-S-isoprenylcysteine O-methyltransferase [Candida parapsilosis]